MKNGIHLFPKRKNYVFLNRLFKHQFLSGLFIFFVVLALQGFDKSMYIKPLTLGYKSIIPEPIIKNLHMTGRDDSGIGLIKQQLYIADKFGLKTYQNCKEMVCHPHGKALRDLIKKHRFDRKKLIAFDDQFHPILNIDATARMLTIYKDKSIKGISDKWKTAIRRYAGKYNYQNYWKKGCFYQKKLSDPNLLILVKKSL